MRLFLSFLICFGVMACNNPKQPNLNVRIFQTSASGDKLTEKQDLKVEGAIKDTIELFTSTQFQTIEGIGGAFTESSAYLLNKLSKTKREEVLRAYFGPEGAEYSLTRTHMNSCDFSLDHYSYAPVEGDTNLDSFSIEHDLNDLVPMIKGAQSYSVDGFKLLASPWTSPPWMKDNNDWYGGKLKKEYYAVWAKFFSKYVQAYKEQGIDIWGFTVENEPLGNDANWESMHFTPEETADFVKHHLAPQLKADNIDAKILVFDQNRGKDLEEWSQKLLTDEELLPLIHGTAVHWYASTFDWFPENLQNTHQLAPDKHIIQTEGCVDAEVPHWNDGAWYWSKEATDWGWDWAPEKDKHMHPKYVPVFRYARDIIGCLNNWVEGWIDWNMVLDRQGGPNLAKNWCVAPVIVDAERDEVYYTPLYYVMAQFSKYARPGAKRIEVKSTDDTLMTSAVLNPDGTIALFVLNMDKASKKFVLRKDGKTTQVSIDGNSLQTIIF